LGSNFGFQVNIWKDKDSFVLGILAASQADFIQTISPFTLPSFRYKII
jgi:hypothetical protein